MASNELQFITPFGNKREGRILLANRGSGGLTAVPQVNIEEKLESQQSSVGHDCRETVAGG